MKLKWLFYGALLFIFSLSGCSEGLQEEQSISRAVKKGSILVINEVAQVLNCIDPDDHTISQVSYVGNSANDIEIDGDFAYVLASQNNTIFKIDLKNGGFIKTLSLIEDYTSLPSPYNQAIDSNNIYISFWENGKLGIVDKSSFSLKKSVILGSSSYPEGVAVDSNYVYVALTYYNGGSYSDRKVAIVDKNSYQIITNINVLTNPQSVAMDKNGALWVACTGYYNTNIWLYEKGGLTKIVKVGEIFTANTVNQDASYYVVKFDGDRIYAIDSLYSTTASGLNVYLLDGTKVTNILAGKNLKGIDFDNNYIYVSEAYGGNSVYIINKNTYSITTINNTGGGDLALYK